MIASGRTTMPSMGFVISSKDNEKKTMMMIAYLQ